MVRKDEILALATAELSAWEAVVGRLSEQQRTARQLPADLSVKDVLAHLHAWQRISIARLEAARADREPEYAGWPADFDPEQDDVDTINAWIHATYRDQSWDSVYEAWHAGYCRFLELAAAISEQDLEDPKRYPWLNGRPLVDVLVGSYEHHHIDHLEPLETWLAQQGADRGSR